MKFFSLFIVFCTLLSAESMVTYEISCGRFGDYTTDFIHGRWVSYKAGIPLIYTPCALSEALVLSKKHIRQKVEEFDFDQTVVCYRPDHIKPDKNTLFWVPHFTPFTSDSSLFAGFANRPPSFSLCHLIDWRDKAFLQILREEVAPLEPLTLFLPKTGFHNIGLHYREGGHFDQAKWKQYFPLKFVSFDFYLETLSELVRSLPPGPLFVALFSDVVDPQAVVEQIDAHLKQHHPDRTAVVEIALGTKGDGEGILVDFFSLAKFPYIIGADTLFSYLAARIGECRLWLKPELFAFDASGHRRLYSSLVGYDMGYKTASDKLTLSFDPISGDFEKDLEDIFRYGYFCHQHGYVFDLVMTHPLYQNLRKSWLSPIQREEECDLQDKQLPYVEAIDWTDGIFLAQMREVFSQKKACTLPLQKAVPSVALHEMVDLFTYLEVVRENHWQHHQLYIILTKDYNAAIKNLKKQQYQLLLKKEGVHNVDIHVISLVENPLEVFFTVGHCNYVLTTPHFAIETAAKIFTPLPCLIIR